MENKEKKIEVINVAGNPERKIKAQTEMRQKQVLDIVKEDLNRR